MSKNQEVPKTPEIKNVKMQTAVLTKHPFARGMLTFKPVGSPDYYRLPKPNLPDFEKLRDGGFGNVQTFHICDDVNDSDKPFAASYSIANIMEVIESFKNPN